jgi:hypothetical protein
MFAASANGQTIGDYSRAQATALEHSMMQSIARPLSAVAGTPGEPPAAPAADAGITVKPARTTPEGESASRRVSRDILVSGVFATRTKTVAEVTVDGIRYWLVEGDVVPHTSWFLRRVTVDRVELGRRAAASASPPVDRELMTRTVEIPAAQ